MAPYKRIEPSADTPSHEWWTGYEFPPKLHNQNFADLLDDEEVESLVQAKQSRVKKNVGGYSEVDDNGTSLIFGLKLDHFELQDLKVYASQEYLTVSGKHQEKQDCGSHTIEREFVRKYPLPKNAIYENIEADYFERKIVIEVPLKIAPELVEVKISPILPLAETKKRSALICEHRKPELLEQNLSLTNEEIRECVKDIVEKLEKVAKLDKVTDGEAVTEYQKLLQEISDVGKEALTAEETADKVRKLVQIQKLVNALDTIPIEVTDTENGYSLSTERSVDEHDKSEVPVTVSVTSKLSETSSEHQSKSSAEESKSLAEKAQPSMTEKSKSLEKDSKSEASTEKSKSLEKDSKSEASTEKSKSLEKDSKSEASTEKSKSLEKDSKSEASTGKSKSVTKVTSLPKPEETEVPEKSADLDTSKNSNDKTVSEIATSPVEEETVKELKLSDGKSNDTTEKVRNVDSSRKNSKESDGSEKSECESDKPKFVSEKETAPAAITTRSLRKGTATPKKQPRK